MCILNLTISHGSINTLKFFEELFVSFFFFSKQKHKKKMSVTSKQVVELDSTYGAHK